MGNKKLSDLTKVDIDLGSIVEIDYNSKLLDYSYDNLKEIAKCKADSVEGAIAIRMANEIIRLNDEIHEIKELLKVISKVKDLEELLKSDKEK
jgi:hypothetical protein